MKVVLDDFDDRVLFEGRARLLGRIVVRHHGVLVAAISAASRTLDARGA